MNDWEIKKFLRVVIAIQLAVLGVIGLEMINLQIPILRELVTFIYLTFVPGILILRILKLHKLSNIETLLYTVGLSIVSLMFIGFFMNMVYPLFGISGPISIFPLIVTISLFVLVLCVLSYVRDKEFFDPDFVDIENILSPWTLFLCLIPFLSIFGPYLMNFYGNNILQMTSLLLIAILLPVVLKWMPEKFLPLAVFIISISLLYRTTLISTHIWGADINSEFYHSTIVLENFHWNPAIYSNINAMLSIVILAPIYSIISDMSLIWIFKIVYPTLFSLIPLGLFTIYKEQTSKKIAFLACFFFMSFFIFYTGMPALARQQIAGLFFVILMLLMLNKNMSKSSIAILLTIFGASMIVSHYGLAYIFIFFVILVWLLSLNLPSKILQLVNKVHFFTDELSKPIQSGKIHTTNKLSKAFQSSDNKNYTLIGKTYPLFLISFTITWFMYVSSSSIFVTGVNIGNSILGSITDLLNPLTSQGVYIIIGEMPIFQSIERYLHIVSQVFIATGIIKVLIDRGMRFNQEYKAFSVFAFTIAGAGILLPYFAAAMNSDRLYHITLFFLAPFFVIGFITFIEALVKLVKKVFKFKQNAFKVDRNRSLYFVSAFLIVYFLFNSAFIYQIFDQPKVGRFALDNDVDFLWLNEKEIASIEWLEDKKNPEIEVKADVNKAVLLGGMIGPNAVEINRFHIEDGRVFKSYIFLGAFNIENHQLLIRTAWNRVEYIEDPGFRLKMNKIYDNSGGYILMGRER